MPPEELSWEHERVNIAIEVAEALIYLHLFRPKVIHRDLKAKNVLTIEKNHPKLCDFGLSRRNSIEETMTVGIGTLLWTAPEILKGTSYWEKADIYSFGVMELDSHEIPYYNQLNSRGNPIKGPEICHLVVGNTIRPAFSATIP